MNRFSCTLALALLVAVSNAGTQAQTAGQPVGQGSGPVRGLSTNAGNGSGPVRGSVGSSWNAGPLSGSPVRGSVTGDVLSGTPSDISVGPATADNPMAGGGSVGQASAGAVKKNIDSPLGEMISAPLRDLGPLQDRLRAIQPLPRDASAPDGGAPSAEDTADTGNATEPDTEANEPVDDTEAPENTEAPEDAEGPASPPAPQVESQAAQQPEDDPLKPFAEPQATPAAGAPQVEP